MRSRLRVLLLVVCLLFAGRAFAQLTLGSINGTVTDSSGAAVPGTTVTVTDAAIGVTRSAKSGSDGFFQIFNLPVGNYSVRATHDGFDTTEMPTIAVQEAHGTTLSMQLRWVRSRPR